MLIKIEMVYIWTVNSGKIIYIYSLCDVRVINVLCNTECDILYPLLCIYVLIVCYHIMSVTKYIQCDIHALIVY